MHRVLRTVLTGLVVLLILTVGGYFLFRNMLLHWAIDKVTHKLEVRYHTQLHIDEAAFSGLSNLELHGITLVPHKADTLLKLNQLTGSIKLLKLLTGQVQFSQFDLSDGAISLVRYDSTHGNYSAFLEGSGKKERDTTQKINLAEKAYELIDRTLDQVPGQLHIHNFSISYQKDTSRYGFSFTDVGLEDEQLLAKVHVFYPGATQDWLAKGAFSPDDMQGDLLIKSESGAPMVLPVAESKWGLRLQGDELKLQLKQVKFNDDHLTVESFASFRNLVVNHARLAKNDVVVSSAAGDFNFYVGANDVALDSTSRITFNKMVFHPYLRYQHKPEKTYTIRLTSDRTPAQDFFSSMPKGMFSSLEGIKADGYLTYRMHFFLDDLHPYDVDFDSELVPEQFHIIHYGEAYLPKLNGSFQYTFYDNNGRAANTFEVGDPGKGYTELDAISPYLKNAVLTSEDPSFFGHQGFIMEAIRQSIATNYVRRRFVRGGSTISMQLVKNVFLSRQKTFARKFEEMLLVWMLEHLHVASKSRMYEVYLNIIEWGPGVFGVGEASRFYFNKTPDQLNLNEAIFLSSIIPSPKAFRYRFDDSTMQIKPYLEGYFRTIAKLMVSRKLMEPTDTIGFVPGVQLKSPALQYIKKKPAVPEELEDDELNQGIPREAGEGESLFGR